MVTVREGIKESIDALVSRLPCEDSARALLSRSSMFPTFRGHHAMVRIMRRVLEVDSYTVDAGANRGDILQHLLRLAPQGDHEAFEPQPNIAALLSERFKDSPNVNIHCKALGSEAGACSFVSYRKAPRLSTFFPRPDLDSYFPECIEVEVATLDTVLLPRKLDFMKVDVEGSELNVFRGAQRRLLTDQPYIVFETNASALRAAGATFAGITQFLGEECSLAVYSLHEWLKGNGPLSADELESRANSGSENDFFAAHPDSHRATPNRGLK